MLDYGLRGKPYASTAKRWLVMVHAMNYEEPELVEKCEKVLSELKRRDDKSLEENTEMYLRLGYRPLEAIYHGARVTLLMAE